MTDTARSVLDGHIVLSRSLANRNQYPAIDVLASVSRVMPDIITDQHKEAAAEVKRRLLFTGMEDLINIGAYVSGSNEKIDYAISLIDKINGFIRQLVEERYDFDDVLGLLYGILQ